MFNPELYETFYSNQHEYHKRNTRGRDFVVGDLHGCYDELIRQMRVLKFDKEKDRMFSVGDLVDRGPKSYECLSLIKEPWFFPVIGNHEDMMLFGKVEGSFDMMQCWYDNGGEWDAVIGGGELAEYEELLELTRMLPLTRTVETSAGLIGICHAEVPYVGFNWDVAVSGKLGGKDILEMLWGRKYLRPKYNAPDSVTHIPRTAHVYRTVHGHTPVPEITRLGNAVWIDTGMVYGNKLTVMEIT